MTIAPAVIDAHHHFWRYDAAEFGWIDDGMASIRRDFLPSDLASVIEKAGVNAVVSVQARQTIEETRWLLDLADQYPFIAGIVGWAPLAAASIEDDLAHLAAHPKLKALRHVLQGEPDERYMLRADFNRGVDALREYELAYDILIYERHLPQTIEFVDRHPNQVFIVDHAAKPRIRENALDPWRIRLREMARRPHVYCKLSGMVTEAEYRAWTIPQLRPYVETVIEAFGPARVIFGSDWPVCLVACEYARWADIVRDFSADLSASERADIMGGTARRAYRLESDVAEKPTGNAAVTLSKAKGLSR